MFRFSDTVAPVGAAPGPAGPVPEAPTAPPTKSKRRRRRRRKKTSKIEPLKHHDAPMTKRDLYFSLSLGSLDGVPRVTLVNWDGEVVLEAAVDPEGAVRSQMENILRGKILIGHGLSRTLRVLNLIHPATDVRDTATFFRQEHLQVLAGEVLQRNLEEGSLEECMAALDLYKARRPQWEEHLILQQQQESQEQQRRLLYSAGMDPRLQQPHAYMAQQQAYAAAVPAPHPPQVYRMAQPPVHAMYYNVQQQPVYPRAAYTQFAPQVAVVPSNVAVSEPPPPPEVPPPQPVSSPSSSSWFRRKLRSPSPAERKQAAGEPRETNEDEEALLPDETLLSEHDGYQAPRYFCPPPPTSASSSSSGSWFKFRRPKSPEESEKQEVLPGLLEAWGEKSTEEPWKQVEQHDGYQAPRYFAEPPLTESTSSGWFSFRRKSEAAIPVLQGTFESDDSIDVLRPRLCTESTVPVSDEDWLNDFFNFDNKLSTTNP